VAGVLAALTIPASTLCDASRYLVVTRRSLDNFEEASKREDAGVIVNEDQVTALQVMSMATNNVTTPLQRLEVSLHPWSAFVIMPIFALANAGVSLEGLGLDALTHSSALGILVGLVIGKQIGVFGFSWLFVRLGLVSRLEGVSWRQVYGAACLAGIGFTMSMFIGGLAFATPELLNEAKLAIIVSSVVSASIGSAVLIGAAQSEPAPA
jgi:NhaA family Na+:H+ antiporter